MRDSRPAQTLAKTRLSEMGSMSRDETVMAAACSFTIVLWILGGVLGQHRKWSFPAFRALAISFTTTLGSSHFRQARISWKSRCF